MPNSIPFRLETRTLLFGLAFVAVLLSVMVPAPVRADHGAPTATSIAELVYQLGLRLDELATEFGFEPGESPTFDEDRFNRLLRKSRMSLDQAIEQVDRDQVCKGFYKLTRSVSQLESAADYGAEQNMSGWGFADDLASLASFISESFLEDLIVLASQAGADEGDLGHASEAELSGDILRDAGEWTAAMEQFAVGTCALL